jgi:hypothetical protein
MVLFWDLSILIATPVPMIQIVQDATARGTTATIVALNGPRHQESHHWYNFQRSSVGVAVAVAAAAAWTKSRRTSVGMVLVDQVLRQ